MTKLIYFAIGRMYSVPNNSSLDPSKLGFQGQSAVVMLLKKAYTYIPAHKMNRLARKRWNSKHRQAQAMCWKLDYPPDPKDQLYLTGHCQRSRKGSAHLLLGWGHDLAIHADPTRFCSHTPVNSADLLNGNGLAVKSDPMRDGENP